MSSNPLTPSDTLPRAQVRPRRWSIAWIIPVLAAVFAGYLLWQSWQMRGRVIIIVFDQGHGIRVGHSLLYRGVKVGEVSNISLTADFSAAEVEATLLPNADHIARKGTQFWVVRPDIGPTGVTGLETILGPNYIAVQPVEQGERAERRTRFIGLTAAPVIHQSGASDLEVILEAKSRGSLQVGAPVTYRGIRIGTILSVALASDGSAVEAPVHIDQNFAPLITPQTRFWDSGGVNLDIGLTGASVRVDSLTDLLVGGVSIAVPPNAGQTVNTGHRFELAADPRSEWLSWEPSVPIGVALLPPGATLPALERARLRYKTDTWTVDKSRFGWVLPTETGFVGPANLITEPAGARNGTGQLQLAGQTLAAPRDATWEINGIGYIPTQVSENTWLRSRMRLMSEPEDCLIVAGSTNATVPVGAVRLTPGDGSFKIDEAVSFDASWTGAAVLSRNDGLLVGILLVEDGVGEIALLPEPMLKPAGGE